MRFPWWHDACCVWCLTECLTFFCTHTNYTLRWVIKMNVWQPAFSNVGSGLFQINQQFLWNKDVMDIYINSAPTFGRRYDIKVLHVVGFYLVTKPQENACMELWKQKTTVCSNESLANRTAPLSNPKRSHIQHYDPDVFWCCEAQ